MATYRVAKVNATTNRFGPTVEAAFGVSNAQAAAIDAGDAAVMAQVNAFGLMAVNGKSIWKNALDPVYGVVGDNTTDDTVALQAWANSLDLDEIGYLPPRRYRTNAPIRIKAGTRILAFQRRRPRDSYDSKTSIGDGAYISPRSTFAGEAVIDIVDGRTAGLTTMTQGVIIDGVNINCSALPVGSTVAAIRVYGSVQGTTLENLSIRGAPVGIDLARNPDVASGPVAPFSLRMKRIFITGLGTAVSTHGIRAYNPTDVTMDDVQIIGIGGDGFTLQGGGNTTLLACRVENSTGRGFVIDQTAGGSKASVTLIGCSTNLNTGASVDIANAQSVRVIGHVSNDVATTAAYDIHSSSGRVYLDGCEAKAPGEGATSAIGLRVTGNAFLSVDGGAYWGLTVGISDGGGNTAFYRSPNVIESKENPAVITASGVRTSLDGTLLGKAAAFTDPVTVGAPTASGHAATKSYVDANYGGGLLSTETQTASVTLSTNPANVVEVNSPTDVTVTLPGGIPVGTSFEIYQAGAGRVTVAGTSLRIAAPSTGAKTPGQYGSIYVRARPSSAPPATNMLMRYRADDLAGANGSAVSSWAESSGQGLPAAVQATSANQPTVLVNAGGTGHKGVLFDGTNDYLALSGSALALANNRSALTVFIAMALTTALTTSTRTALALSPNATSAASRLAIGPRETSGGRPYASGRRLDADSLAQVTGSAAIATVQNTVLTARYIYSASDLYLYKDGTQVGSSTSFQTDGSTQANNSQSGTIGANAAAGGEWFLGAILEILVYADSDTSGALRGAVHAYIQQQYGIVSSDSSSTGEYVLAGGVA